VIKHGRVVAAAVRDWIGPGPQGSTWGASAKAGASARSTQFKQDDTSWMKGRKAGDRRGGKPGRGETRRPARQSKKRAPLG